MVLFFKVVPSSSSSIQYESLPKNAGIIVINSEFSRIFSFWSLLFVVDSKQGIYGETSLANKLDKQSNVWAESSIIFVNRRYPVGVSSRRRKTIINLIRKNINWRRQSFNPALVLLFNSSRSEPVKTFRKYTLHLTF